MFFSHARFDLYNRGLKALLNLKVYLEIFLLILTQAYLSLIIRLNPLFCMDVKFGVGVCSPLSASVRNEPDFKIEKAYMNFDVKRFQLKLISIF